MWLFDILFNFLQQTLHYWAVYGLSGHRGLNVQLLHVVTKVQRTEVEFVNLEMKLSKTLHVKYSDSDSAIPYAQVRYG